MSSLQLLLCITLAALLLGARAQEFNLLPSSNPMEFSSCQPEEEVSISVRSDIECMVRASPGSQMISYRPDTGRCTRISRCDLITVRSEGFATARPESSSIFYQRSRPLLYAIKGGSGIDANSTFASSANCNDSLLPLPYGQAPTVQLWRSCWLDRLPELVQRLSLSSIVLHLIKGGSDAMNITFDATFSGLNSWNWFAKEHVVSYWPQTLNIPSQTFPAFSIQGIQKPTETPPLSRIFYINLVFGTCTTDLGYLVVSPVADVCGYIQNAASNFPKILYNVDPSKPWSQSTSVADYLAISIL